MFIKDESFMNLIYISSWTLFQTLVNSWRPYMLNCDAMFKGPDIEYVAGVAQNRNERYQRRSPTPPPVINFTYWFYNLAYFFIDCYFDFNHLKTYDHDRQSSPKNILLRIKMFIRFLIKNKLLSKFEWDTGHFFFQKCWFCITIVYLISLNV